MSAFFAVIGGRWGKLPEDSDKEPSKKNQLCPRGREHEARGGGVGWRWGYQGGGYE